MWNSWFLPLLANTAKKLLFFSCGRHLPLRMPLNVRQCRTVKKKINDILLLTIFPPEKVSVCPSPLFYENAFYCKSKGIYKSSTLVPGETSTRWFKEEIFESFSSKCLFLKLKGLSSRTWQWSIDCLHNSEMVWKWREVDINSAAYWNSSNILFHLT